MWIGFHRHRRLKLQLAGCDLNLKQPQQKERQKDLFFAKTESIFEPLKLLPLHTHYQAPIYWWAKFFEKMFHRGMKLTKIKYTILGS